MEEDMEVFVDYEILHECQYPVLDSGSPDLEGDCGEPAMYRVYWTLEDGTDAGEMLVCQKHFDFIMECEKNQGKG